MSTWLAEVMEKRVAADATAQEMAAALFTVALAIDTALVPTLGPAAVKQLFERTLAAGARTYPWMSGDCQDHAGGLDLERMSLLFSQQTSAAAAAGARLLLQTFYDSLAGMVGVPLTEQLLRPVWANYQVP